MTRLCERPGCSQVAEMTYGFDAEHLMVWIDSYDRVATGRAGVLCRRHADAMVVPLAGRSTIAAIRFLGCSRRRPFRLYACHVPPRAAHHRDDTEQLELGVDAAVMELDDVSDRPRRRHVDAGRHRGAALEAGLRSDRRSRRPARGPRAAAGASLRGKDDGRAAERQRRRSGPRPTSAVASPGWSPDRATCAAAPVACRCVRRCRVWPAASASARRAVSVSMRSLMRVSAFDSLSAISVWWLQMYSARSAAHVVGPADRSRRRSSGADREDAGNRRSGYRDEDLLGGVHAGG